MNIKQALVNLSSIAIYTLLLFSSTILGGLLYLDFFHDNIISEIKISFIEDIKNSKQFDVGSVDKDMLSYACELGIVDLSPYGLEKYETLLCAKIKAGKIKNTDDIKVFFADAYFKENIIPILEGNLFNMVKDYLILVGVITFILAIIEFLVSLKTSKKSVIFSILIGVISISFIVYVLEGVINKQLDSSIPYQYQKNMINIINTVKKLLKEGIIYSIVFGFILSSLSQISGMAFGLKMKNNVKKVKK